MGSGRSQLEVGREAFERRAWRAAHDALAAAHETAALDAPDLWSLATASYLIGDEADFVRALQDAHQGSLDAGDRVKAARYAFWLGLHLANRSEMSRAGGWFGRATRLLEHENPECAERGYLLLPESLKRLIGGEYEAAARTAAEAVVVAQRCGDGDLLALALHLQGRALVRHARTADGLALLDEAMVAVAADELSPQVTGLIYCGTIGACREVHALRRAHEWTAALTAWCESQPDMVSYTGECRVYRAEILQLRGEWQEAMDEARRASECFARGSHPDASGLALYQQGEVHRLRGELDLAEEAYRAASRAGRQPQPGMALLRVAQGDHAAGASAIRRALAEAEEGFRRSRLLPACVDIMLEAGEIDEARGACAELEDLARECATGVLVTLATHARGAVELASGNATGALAPLRRASRDWQALAAPHAAARARMLLGLACRALGDVDGAELELEAARAGFERLGAAIDLARLDALARPTPARARAGEHGLTPREREVLALLATGRTNRAIAEGLCISDKTVARHVANIFGKLGVSSRAAATAFAYEHDLLGPST